MRRAALTRLGTVGAAALAAGLVLPVSAPAAGAAGTVAGTSARLTPAGLTSARLTPAAVPVGQLDGSEAAALGAHATQPVLVLFKDQVAALADSPAESRSRQGALAGIQAPVVAELHQLRAAHLRTYSLLDAVSATVSPAEMARLAADPAVGSVVPDQSTTLDFTAPRTPAAAPVVAAPSNASPSSASPSGATSACQPGSGGVELDPQALETIHANSNLPGSGPTAASIGLTGAGVKVAFIAEGFAVNQPNFIRPDGSKVFVDEKDFTGEGVGASSGGEASLDASSIAAQGLTRYQIGLANGSTCTFRVLGAAPGASLVGLKIFSNSYAATTSSILAAIDYAVSTDHVDVLNESFGYNPLPDTMTDVVRQADEAAVQAGTVVDVSTGDAGATSTVGSPSTDPAVLAAGATTTYRVYAQEGIAPSTVHFKGWEDDNLSSLSSGGFTEGLKGPNLVAPGDLNWVTCNPAPHQYSACISGGTSEAAPLTSAVAALVIQAYRKTHGGSSPTPALVKQLITSTTTDLGLPADQQGSGLLDAYQAVLAAESVKTPAGAPSPKGMTVVTSTDSIGATAPVGTTVSKQVQVTNLGGGTQTVALSGRVLSSPANLLSTSFKERSASFTHKLTFKVQSGTAYLAAHAALTSTSSSGFVDVDLVDPFGRLAIDGLPQGSTLTSNVGVRYPAAGTWTAYVTFGGSGAAPSSPVAFQATSQAWQPFGTVSPATLRLAAGATKSVTVKVTTPATAGDETAALQLSTSMGVQTSVPIALRSLVPLSKGSGTFAARVFGGNGRGGGPASTQYFAFDVAKGQPELNVSTAFSNGNANDYSLMLISPTGEALGHASNQLMVGGSGSAPVFMTETGAASHVLSPAAGRWTVIVAFTNPASGSSVSSELTGKIDTSPVTAKSAGLPQSGGVVGIGSSKAVSVTIKNTTDAPQAYWLDPRLDATVTRTLSVYQSKASVSLPLPSTAPIPQFIVPTDTTQLRGQVSATAGVTFDMSPYLGNFGGELNGDPQVSATSMGDTASATWADAPVTPGDWNVDPALTGVWGKTGTPSASAIVSLQATTLGFDSSITTRYGDFWKDGAVSPVIVQPGRTTTLYAVISPARAGAVKGVLFVDTASELSPFGQVVAAGDQVAAVPYSYTAR